MHKLYLSYGFSRKITINPLGFCKNSSWDVAVIALSALGVQLAKDTHTYIDALDPPGSPCNLLKKGSW